MKHFQWMRNIGLWDRLALGTVVLTLCFWSVLLHIKYAYFGYYDWDLGLYSHVMGNIVRGTTVSTLFGASFLSNHPEYIAFLAAPIYYFFPHPLTLIFLNVFGFCFGAFVFYLFAKKFLSPAVSFWLMLAYLFYPANIFMLMYEFHFESLALPFLWLSLYYFLVEEQLGWFLLFAFLAALCKESAALLVGFWGIAAFWLKKEQKARWAVSALAVGWGTLFLSLFVIIPFFRHQSGNPSPNQYAGYFISTNSQKLPWFLYGLSILKTLFQKLANFQIIFYIKDLFGPLNILPFLSPGVLMLGFPLFLAHMVAADWKMRTIFYHYTATAVPIIFAAAVFSLAKIRKQGWDRLYTVLTVFAVAAALLSPFYWVKSSAFKENTNWVDDLDAARLRFTQKIPERDGVIGTFEFLSHLSSHKNLYSLYSIWLGGNVFSPQSLNAIDKGTDWALNDFMCPWFLVGIYTNPVKDATLMAERLNMFFSKGDWRVAGAADSVILLKKNGKGPKLVETLQGVKEEGEPLMTLGHAIGLVHVNIIPPHQRGDAIPVAFVWEVRRRCDNFYFMSIDVVKNGKTVFRRLRLIGYAINPTPLWKPGDIVRERYWLTVPAEIGSGEFELRASFYNSNIIYSSLKKEWDTKQKKDDAPSILLGKILIP
jgi:uncharacterized membrane protein